MSTLKFEAAPPPAHAPTTSDAPRKKRKRAPAQGAADDCFTCSNRSIKCDRRRPYCSQCLNGGQDCSGYKTQLTWGVGVASRGKLRGLSLPVAGATKQQTDTVKPAPKSRKRIGSVKQERSPKKPQPQPQPVLLTRTKSPEVRHANTDLKISVPGLSSSNHTTNHGPYIPQSLSMQDASVHTLPESGHTRASPQILNRYNAAVGISPVSTTFSPTTNLPQFHDKPSMLQYSPYPTPSPTHQYFQPFVPRPPMPPTPTIHSYPSSLEPHLVLPSAYHQISHIPYAGQHEYADQMVYASSSAMPEVMISNTAFANADEDVEEVNRDFNSDGTFSDALSVSSSSFPMDSGFSFPLSGLGVVGKNPRIQYLIQYYAEVIAPVLVAFDSPSNPLRNQILGLAASSESLQHAISALAASNIRQRQESGTLSTGKTPGARRSSYMHVNLTSEVYDDSQALTKQDRKREESLHKYAAVRKLNQQLANPHTRKDDSVLATLLMLCLFHICDSGIARFQTQFAGVKKLLALRGANTRGSHGDAKWMTRIFTLFDSVAATVNDREGQIDGEYVDISSQADGEWPYETFTGLDSNLFKCVSRLGRLNILSQGKPSESNPTLVSRPFPNMAYLNGHPANDPGTFDGNGWMRIITDEDLFNAKTAIPSVQEQFWREWREVRHELQIWVFNDTRFDGSDHSQTYLTPDQRYDLRNISESFRYSCLLYTERLANPTLPSTDPQIQEWVQKSLYHIKQVRADVYLLWPLFITGAECGDDQERNIIRERCLDIQKDSGFVNNSSCLSLLEKVWRGTSVANEGQGGLKREPSTFKFRDVMLAEGNEGEWIVI